jgi:ATP-dependent helicase HrpB
MKARLPDLPVREALPALRLALAREGRAVLAAPPGSGKTTVVPLALLDEPWLAGRKIVLLEPRRLAARAAARRMASLCDEAVGETVGYQVRFERRISPRTRVEVITEGLLTRRLQADAELPGIGLVIFDEFHERSLDVDLALALTLDARANLNPDLRVLVMSATLDTGAVARLLGGAPVIESSGRMYPVEVRYRPPRADQAIDAAAAQGVTTALAETPGDVLVFLPGAREIRDTQRHLQERAGRDVSIHPLYGDLSSAEQDAALLPAPDGHRKVILATNIAQTSLTVEGVTAVVDSGFVRVARFDLGAGANRLDTERVSRASAEQRAGRAGRLGPGVAYRLWSEEQHGRLAAHDTPEILSADLTRFALEIAAWGTTDFSKVALSNPPAPAAWSYAQDLLRELGAIDRDGRVSAQGRELIRLPASPRLGHMLLRAQREGLAGTAAWIAALLEERDSGGTGTDLAARLALSRGRDGARARDAVRQLLRLLDASGEPDVDESALGRVLSWAYPERIARRRPGAAAVYQCEDGGEARLPEKDSLAGIEWLAIAHWDPAKNRRIRLAAPLDEAQVLEDHVERVVTRDEVTWDASAQAVVAEEQRRLGALVLQRKPLRSEGVRQLQRAAMLEGIRQMGIEALPWNEETRQWQARVLSLRRWREDEQWPDVSDPALLATLAEWLEPYLDGITRRAHLAQLDLLEILGSRFDYATRGKLDRLVPTHVEVPTGSRIRLSYQPPNAPALEVKLQEMFGCRDTPTVNGGRTKVVLHLLSPGQRPVAVTQDLAGFWARGYVDVKKDMKGRYPRHPWPDDPVSALPTRRAKPRGT